jgi:hypothetical protein
MHMARGIVESTWATMAENLTKPGLGRMPDANSATCSIVQGRLSELALPQQGKLSVWPLGAALS